MNMYLFGGYTVVWTVLFFFLFFLVRKQKALSDRLGSLVDNHKDRE